MTTKRSLVGVLFVAAFLVPAGVLLAQETPEPSPEEPVATESSITTTKTVIMSPDGSPVPVEFSSGPAGPGGYRTSGPFAPRAGRRPRASEEPGRPPGQPPHGPGGRPEKPDEKKGKPGEEKKGEEKKGEEGPKPIQRPTTPPVPADPDAIRKMKLGPDGKITFNFTGHPWREVLLWLAQISGLSLDWQELPGDYLYLVTQDRYDLDEARDMLNRLLLDRGYTMLRRGEVLSVVKIEKLKDNPGLVPRVEPDELDQRDPHEFVKVSFKLDSMLAESAAEELKPMLSKYAILTPLAATNRLEAMDSVRNLRELRRFLKEEQSTETQQEVVREFRLKYTRAEDVKQQALALLGMPSESSDRGPRRPMSSDVMRQMQKQMQEQMKKMQQMAAQAGKKPGGGATMPRRETRVALIVNKRKNSILAYAPPDKMVIIAQTIEALDQPSDRTGSPADYINRTQVYRLETIEPEPVISTLEEMGDLNPMTRLEADNENNAIIACASLVDHATISLLINKLDGGGRRIHVIPLKRLRAESVAQTIAFMMAGGTRQEDGSDRRRDFDPFGYRSYSPSRYGRDSRGSSEQFRVDADVRNNALVLWANQFEVEKVEELLKDLRQLPPKDGGPNTVRTYRLAAIDPAPVVSTLEEMDTLEPHTTLQVDEENNAIIAFASPADHKKISDLLGQLDGSSRKLEVIPLRRLEADYVAGTIELLMTGKGGQQSNSSSVYIYDSWDRRSRDRDRARNADEFRVDADVMFNRLFVYANELELAQVKDFLVQLGEIPPEEGRSDTVRVFDTGGGKELEAMIEQLRRTWPSMAPNTLLLLPPEEPEEPPEAGSEEKKPETASPPKDTTAQTGQPVFRLAQLRQEVAEGEGSQDPVDGAAPDVEASKGPAAGNVEEPPKTERAAPGAEAPQEPKTAGPSGEPGQAPGEVTPGAHAAPDAPGGAPAARAPKDAGGTAEKSRPPVRISWGTDGQVIIASQDTKALDMLEDFMSRFAPPRRDYHVFQLKYAMAVWVSWNLEDFFKEEEDQSGRGGYYYDPYFGYGYGRRDGGDRARLSKRRPLKFIADSDTNTILVQGADPAQLKTIRELIELYDRPEPRDTASVRKTEIILLKYTKAQVVEQALKDVYRDLLSSNDRALQQGREQRIERSTTYYLGGDGGATKMPRWKGQLSIGVDELSNALIVSAPTYLFDDVKAKIVALDEAAKPVSTVQVMQVDGRLSAAGLQAKLAEILGETSGRRPSSGGRPSGRRPGENGPPRPPGPRGPSSFRSYSRGR